MNNSLQTIELINVQDFSVQDLFYKLFEKIRAHHPSIKILIVSWVTFLDSIPEIKLINFLPDLLPGIFSMLCDKTKDVNHSAEKSLKHFIKEIESQFESISTNSPEVINKILEILIEQCKNVHEQARITAFEWMFMFLQKYLTILSSLYNKNFKIQSSYYTKLRSSNFLKKGNENAGGKLNEEQPFIAKSPNFQPEFSFKINNMSSAMNNLNLNNSMSMDNNSEGLNESKIEKEANNLHIPFYLFHKILDVLLLNVDSQNEQILSLAHSCNAALVKMIDFFSLEINTLNVKQFEEVLKNYFDCKKESTIDLILNWISKLFKKFHDEMFTKVDVFIDSFTNILSDTNENVYLKIYQLLYLDF